jgi:hypothetical protein
LLVACCLLPVFPYHPFSPCSLYLVHLSTRLLTTQPCRHCEERSNPGL